MSWTVLFTSPSAGHGWCSRSCPTRARTVLQGFGAGYTDGHRGCERVEEHSCVSWWLQVLPPLGRLHFPSAGHRWGVCSAWGSALAVGWSGAGSRLACRAGGVLTALLCASTATSCSLRAAGGTRSQQMGLSGFWQHPQQEAYGRSWGHSAKGTSNAPRFFLCVHGAMNDREVGDLLSSQGQEQRHLHRSSLPKL